MTDYINRDDVLSYLRELLPLGDAVTIDPAEEIKIVESIPAADVEPVRRGAWVDVTDRPKRWPYDCVLECSLCGERVADDRYKRCPFCGAKMEV